MNNIRDGASRQLREYGIAQQTLCDICGESPHFILYINFASDKRIDVNIKRTFFFVLRRARVRIVYSINQRGKKKNREKNDIKRRNSIYVKFCENESVNNHQSTRRGKKCQHKRWSFAFLLTLELCVHS